MAPADLKRLAKKERRVGDHLPYVRHVDDRTLGLRGGMLMQTIALDGFSFETADTDELNHRLAVRETMLRAAANARIGLYHHIVRRRAAPDLEAHFPDPFSRWMDERRRQRLATRRLFVNHLFLSVVHKPSVGRQGVFDRVFDGARRNSVATSDEAMRALDAAREALTAALRAYGPRTLGRYDGDSGLCSEPLEFLSLILNGELAPMLEPTGDAAQSLAYKRLSFGLDAIESRGAGAADYAAILSFKDYPTSTAAGMLDGLLRLPIEMVTTESFAVADRQVSQERIELALRRLKSADDDTITLRSGLMAAKDAAASGAAAFGEHHFSVLVRAGSIAALDAAAAAAQSALGDVGAVAVREQLNLEPAFWAQFPGNFDYAARKALISTGNCAGLCSLHGFPVGSAEGNHWGQAITVFETTSATPYFFNFHQGDLGNFLVIGPSGSGKTVALNFLIAQAQKVEPRTFFFDKDRGAEIFLRAIGGVYETLAHGQPTGFNPLQLKDSPSARAFLRAFVARLVHSDEAPLSPEELASIGEAVDANYEQPPELRRLRFLRQLLAGSRRPQAGDLAGRLARWCGKGEFAWVFDNAEDRHASGARVVGFDMTELLDQPALRTPVMMYLFHRIEERLDGSPTIIVIDEGWKALDDDVFASRLKDWFKTIRKKNGVVGFCTQSARDALDSRIASAIREQAAVQMFLPNPRAQESDYCAGFGLTAHEFEIVKSLPEASRCFLIKTGAESVVARLDLSDDPEALRILSGRERSVRALDALRAKVGDHPSRWLPLLLSGGADRRQPAEERPHRSLAAAGGAS